MMLKVVEKAQTHVTAAYIIMLHQLSEAATS